MKVTLFLLVSLLGINSINSSPFEKKGCDSEECKVAAKRLVANMDTSVDPCEDFYLYACGNFKNVNPLPNRRGFILGLGLVDVELKERTKGLMENDSLKTHGSKVVQKAKQMYDNCMGKVQYNVDNEIKQVIDNQKLKLTQLREQLMKGNVSVHTFIPIDIDMEIERLNNLLHSGRSDQCQAVVENKYPAVIDRLYVDKYFGHEEAIASKDMIVNIITSVTEDLKVNWASEDAQSQIQRQLKETKYNIGYPEWLTDDKELDKEYDGKEHYPWPIPVRMVNAVFSYDSRNPIAKSHITIPACMVHVKFDKYFNYFFYFM